MSIDAFIPMWKCWENVTDVHVEHIIRRKDEQYLTERSGWINFKLESFESEFGRRKNVCNQMLI